MTAAMDRWRAAKRQVRRVKDAIEKEADPAEKMDLQELLDKDELAVVAAYAAYETARAQLRP